MTMKQGFLISFVMLFLFSCRKDTQETTSPATTSKSDELYKKLLAVGFTKENIKETGRYYLVTGDLLFDKYNTDMTYFDRYFARPTIKEKDAQNRHWILPDVVTPYNIENMKIEIDEYSNNGEISDWRRSAAQAMTAWAGITNCNINFTRYFNNWSGPTYIDIVDDQGQLDNSTIAAALFPTNGSPSTQILVNLDFNSNMTVSAGQRVYNLVHELGHCIGFHHTNWQSQGEPQYGASAILTTSAGADANSVMNGGTALNSWVGFSSDDQTAARTIYPPGPYTNWITSPNSGKYPGYSHYYLYDYYDNITVTWNASLVSTSTVTLQVFQNGVFKQTIATGIPNNGSYAYPLMGAADGGLGSSSIFEVQVKIISDTDPSIFDFSSMFDIDID